MTSPKAIDALQAILLISKHLDALLPFLLALRRVPGMLPQRIGLVQGLARDIAGNGEFARDWFNALELLSGDDLSGKSVADLLRMSVDLLGNGKVGDVWGVAYEIGLVDEKILQKWIVWEGLTNEKAPPKRGW